MKISYLNCIETNKGWGAETFIHDAFQKLKHQSVCIDYRKERKNLSKHFRKLSNYDVFFLQRGENFPISLIKSTHSPRFYWASELFSRRRDQDNLVKSGCFSHIFVHSTACKEYVIKQGWIPPENVSILLNGFSTKYHYNILNIKKDIDVLFIGNITPRREKILKTINKHYPIVIKTAFGSEMTNLINRAKIILNIHGEEFIDLETRVFEVLGCGSFLISEKLDDINPFNSQQLIECESINEIYDKIDYYLKNEDERIRIAKNGYKISHQNHTYLHRANEIISVFNKHLHEKKEDTLRNLKKHFYISSYIAKQNIYIIKNKIFKK